MWHGKVQIDPLIDATGSVHAAGAAVRDPISERLLHSWVFSSLWTHMHTSRACKNSPINTCWLTPVVKPLNKYRESQMLGQSLI